jgi:CheY-like chemotaxis protein
MLFCLTLHHFDIAWGQPQYLHPFPSAHERNVPAKKILVVDDHDDSREICKQLLSFYGYDVATAADGLEAISLAAAETPDLVLLDFLLPHGTGLETLQALRAQPSLSHTRFVLYTAAITERDALFAIEGVDCILFKPVESAQLLNTVRTLIGSSEPLPLP